MSIRAGRCYELAFARISDMVIFGTSSPDASLIHGVIRDTHLLGQGAIICHAWVEKDGMAWEPITESEMSIDTFMRLFDAEIIHRYSAKQACDLAVEIGHSGPWASMPDEMQRTLRTIATEKWRKQA